MYDDACIRTYFHRVMMMNFLLLLFMLMLLTRTHHYHIHNKNSSHLIRSLPNMVRKQHNIYCLQILIVVFDIITQIIFIMYVSDVLTLCISSNTTSTSEKNKYINKITDCLRSKVIICRHQCYHIEGKKKHFAH